MATTASAKFHATRVFAGLDGLRCCSIVAVVWHHSYRGFLADWLPAVRYGFLGVDLFFAVSGFLIVTLLLRERERKGDVSLPHFYARRTLRIFPVYYGLLGVYSVLYWLVRPDSVGADTFRRDLPYLLLYLTNWVHASGMLTITWSLAAEEQFYLLWPAVEKWLARGAVHVVVAAIAVSQIIHFGLIDETLYRVFGWSPDEPKMLRETTFTPILLGVGLAHALHYPPAFERVYAVLGGRFAAPCLFALLCVVCNFLPDDIRGAGRVSVHVLQISLLASVVLREDNGLARVFTWQPIVQVGVLSYGIYLFHQPALALTSRGLELVHWTHPFLTFLVGLALSVVIAALSYRFYEARFLRLKSHFV